VRAARSGVDAVSCGCVGGFAGPHACDVDVAAGGYGVFAAVAGNQDGVFEGDCAGGGAVGQPGCARGAGHLATAVLGAHDPGRAGLWGAHGLHPLQPGEAWVGGGAGGVAVLFVSAVCEGGGLSGGVGGWGWVGGAVGGAGVGELGAVGVVAWRWCGSVRWCSSKGNCTLRGAGWVGLEQEVALGHGEGGGGFAGEEGSVGADFVGFGVYLDVRGGAVVDHAALADAGAGVADRA
jgi:hypothetical protein